METIRDAPSLQRALHESEQQFRLLVDSVRDYAIYMIDPEGYITSWNAGAQRIKGYAAEEVLGKHFAMFYTTEDIASGQPQQELSQAVQDGRCEGRGWRLSRGGVRFLAHAVITPIVDESGILRGFANVIRDISSHDSAEQRFRQVVESAPSAMVMINSKGVIEMVNAQAERVFGYSREELLGQPVELLLPARFRQHHPQLRAAFLANPQSRPMGAGRDLFGRRKDGSEFPIEIGLNPIETHEGTKVLSAIIDLSTRKRQEDRFRQVVESAPSAMVMINAAGKIEMVNAQAERVFGYTRKELINQPVELLVPQRFADMHPAVRTAFFRDPLARPMGKGRDLFARRKDGSEFPVEIGLNPIETEEGTKVLSAIVDISDRKHKERKIQAALEEKNILLSEVHHRVKNNLQIVHSLLDLQSTRVSDPVALEMLRDSQNRIRSMALIHQSLYLSNDFAQVNLSNVLEALIPALMQSYCVDHSQINY
ncbi:MAG TPA: PAS domain S-box protein, partial [Dongiaceae bacterium]|nr:PAS domain S-box protein [Dongiaceae bacterium]